MDTGPLVAAIDRGDRDHVWSADSLKMIQPPLLTCEAVIAEAWFLLGRVRGGRRVLSQWLRTELVEVVFDFRQDRDRLLNLIDRYESVPMSIADGCLVCLSERYPESVLLTLDSDFLIYRRSDGSVIPLLDRD